MNAFGIAGAFEIDAPAFTRKKKEKSSLSFSTYVKQKESIRKEVWKPFKSLYDLL